MSDDDKITPEMDAEYAEMAKNFLPTCFDLSQMGRAFYIALANNGANSEQAATALAKILHQDVLRVGLGKELDDVDLLRLMNVMGVVMHLRYIQVQPLPGEKP